MTDDTPPVTRLIELLRRQVTLYDQLALMSRQQRDLIATEDPQALLTLLGRRQQVVSALSTLSAELAPLQAYWRTRRVELPGEQRRVVEDLLGQASSMLERVLAADAEDAQRLAARKQTAARTLDQLNTGRQAFSAYRAAATPAPARVNLTDEVL